MKKKYFLITILTVILVSIVSIVIISKVKDNHKKRDDIEIGKTNEETEENMTDDIELQVENEENAIEDERKDTDTDVMKQEETQQKLAEKNTTIISYNSTNMPKSTTSSSSNISNNITISTNNNAEHDDVLGNLVSTVNGAKVNTTTTKQVTLTGTEKQKELTRTETKYGVIINIYTTTIYNVYSDGNKTVKSTSNSTEYDRSKYSANTQSLLAEAKTARSKYASMLNKVIENTNAYRQEANTNVVDGTADRTKLVLDEQLCIAANVRAVEMAYSGKFSHTRPDGSRGINIGNDFGIKVWGENIARGQKSADSVSRSWKNSTGHYSNMISPNYTKIGVGHFELDGTHYWVQLFA